MTRKSVWSVVLFISCIFVLASGVNSGFSEFYMGIPFMLLAFTLSVAVFNWFVAMGTALLIVLSVFVNITLENNPIIFPILQDGQGKVLHDSVHVTFSDGSGGLRVGNPGGSDEAAIIKNVKGGTSFDVTGIIFSPSGFSTTISLMTTIGNISERNYRDNHVRLNKTVHSSWASGISYLMYWPILFIANFPLGVIVFIVALIGFCFAMKKLPNEASR